MDSHAGQRGIVGGKTARRFSPSILNNVLWSGTAKAAEGSDLYYFQPVQLI